MNAPSNTPTPSDADRRAFTWRWLAAAFSYPDAEIREWLEGKPTPEAYLRIFGHTVKGDCPPHELEYGSLHADKLYQPHLLADIAGFYRAFGLELTPEATDRVDHIALEAEFYAVLCAKEAYARVHGLPELDQCLDAQKKFLRDHLARWTPAFSRRVERHTTEEFYQHAARLLRETVLAECARHGVRPGNDDVQLRPVDELTDPCGACGMAMAVPGASLPEE
jgi:TorA maturation chaperone TorD